MIDELRALARAVALDASLRVELGEPGSGWSLEPATGIIRCDPHDIATHHPDEARGLVCHEAAHAAVTRYPHLVPRDLLREPAIASLLNALEDCRIEAWLASRFPGAEVWIERYNERLFPDEPGLLASRPLTHQFALGSIHEWWHGHPAADLDPRVATALTATAAARQAVVDAQPPLRPGADLGGAYQGSRAARCFTRHDRRQPPDPFERAVRLAAWEAWRALWRGVLPVYEDLLRVDQRERKRLAADHQAFLKELHAHVEPTAVRAARRPSAAGMGGGAGEGEVPPGVPELSDDLRASVSEVVGAPPGHAYEAARRAVAGLAGPMADELLAVLRLDAYPHWTPGHASGARPDLAAVMQAQADPRRRLRVWQRKTLPHKHDPGFFLLVDLSGSMEGRAIDVALRGTVLLCEVLHALQLPFGVAGFQDQLLPLKGFADPLDETVRSRIGGMVDEVRGVRVGGHNRPEHNWDGPVVREAAAGLLAHPVGDRVLIVVSDGQPSGPRDAESVLRRAAAEVQADGRVHLVGIGLGPGTEHVARYYAHHAASVPLHAFPAALGRILHACLRGPP